MLLAAIFVLSAAILKIITFQLNLAYLIHIRKTNILTYHTTFQVNYKPRYVCLMFLAAIFVFGGHFENN